MKAHSQLRLHLPERSVPKKPTPVAVEQGRAQNWFRGMHAVVDGFLQPEIVKHIMRSGRRVRIDFSPITEWTQQVQPSVSN